MFDKLNILKNKGYYPDAILDIGAHKGDWTNNMRQIYNNSNYFLFEATNYSELDKLPQNNVKIFNCILNDKIEEVEWYSIYGTGDSFFKEKSHHYENIEHIKKQTISLNALISQNNILQDAKNILIKIDCQGAEIPILKGSTDIFNKTDFILLEIPLFGQYNLNVPNFLEHITFMDSIGFTSYDIIDTHYINNFNMQIDMLFINKNHSFNNIVNELLINK